MSGSLSQHLNSISRERSAEAAPACRCPSFPSTKQGSIPDYAFIASVSVERPPHAQDQERGRGFKDIESTGAWPMFTCRYTISRGTQSISYKSVFQLSQVSLSKRRADLHVPHRRAQLGHNISSTAQLSYQKKKSCTVLNKFTDLHSYRCCLGLHVACGVQVGHT